MAASREEHPQLLLGPVHGVLEALQDERRGERAHGGLGAQVPCLVGVPVGGVVRVDAEHRVVRVDRRACARRSVSARSGTNQRRRGRNDLAADACQFAHRPGVGCAAVLGLNAQNST